MRIFIYAQLNNSMNMILKSNSTYTYIHMYLNINLIYKIKTSCIVFIHKINLCFLHYTYIEIDMHEQKTH